MGYVAAEASTNDAVPGGLVHDVEFCFKYLGDVVKNSLLLKGVLAAVDGMLLHAFTHVGVLNNCHLSFTLWFALDLFRVKAFVVGLLGSLRHYSNKLL